MVFLLYIDRARELQTIAHREQLGCKALDTVLSRVGRINFGPASCVFP